MDKVSEYCGIDVSKSSFDTYNDRCGHKVYPNTLLGFKKVIKDYGSDTHFVMETTGVYHIGLANYIHKQKSKVSVVNALVIKRFSQMLLRSTKTDKADSEMIYKYSLVNQPALWQPPEPYIDRCRDLDGLLNLLLKQRTALKNKHHALKSKGSNERFSLRVLDQQIRSLKRQIEKIELEMEMIIIKHEGDLYQRIKSIPGIGVKTAIFLIVITNGFKQFETGSQVSAYLGLAPSIKISGSSIRGQSRITKAGNNHIRNLLFLSSFTAYKYNPSCKAIFDRITEKGKSKKLALIAVANKLLKQAFALSKSGEYYNPDHISVHPALR